MPSEMPRLKRKSFWDGVAFWVGVAATLLGGVTTLIVADLKMWFVIPATLVGMIALTAAYVSKRCDDRDKAEKAKGEQAERERHQAEIHRAQEEGKVARSEMASLTQRIVRQVLESARVTFFADGDDGEKYKLRATLFRCVGDSASGKRLVIYARAGASESSQREWQVVDDVPENCGGLAGYIWCIESARIVEAPCGWPQDGNAGDKEKYAAALRMTLAEADSLRTKSVCFGGTVVEVGGEKWGVLLLDSLKAGHLRDTRTGGHKRILAQFAFLLGRILREDGE
jgi:hypothetical protein